MAEVRADEFCRVPVHALQIAQQVTHLFETFHEDGVGLPVPAEKVCVDVFELFANFGRGHFHHGARDALGARDHPVRGAAGVRDDHERTQHDT